MTFHVEHTSKKEMEINLVLCPETALEAWELAWCFKDVVDAGGAVRDLSNREKVIVMVRLGTRERP